MTDPIPLEEIERLKKLDEAATPAPWSNDNGHGNIRGPEGGTPIIRFPPIVWGGVDGWQPKETVANAKLTAAARNALPRLLATLEAQQDSIRQLKFVENELRAELERFKQKFKGVRREFHETEQTLGKALGYPPLYPEASEVDDGAVCVGEHVAATLAVEAAGRITRQQAELEQLKHIVDSLPKTADCKPIYFGQRVYVIDDGDEDDEYQDPYDPVEGWFVVQGIEPSCGANGEDLITVCDENDCFEVWSSLCYAKNPIGEPTP